MKRLLLGGLLGIGLRQWYLAMLRRYAATGETLEEWSRAGFTAGLTAGWLADMIVGRLLEED